ncbi:MAG: DNA cytosine methyltransferase [Verrucomicrobia bacterium]|nr:DNA cytosine methyltransferase [Verrucomicrobiota bacterium]
MKKFTYISLFTGAGGLDIGLERAGFRAIALNEIEPVFCDTLRQNQSVTHGDGIRYFESARIINADVRDLSGSDLAGVSSPDLVVGGPPCQAFSSSGKQLSVLDARGQLVNEFVRVVDELKPRMLLFENVRGIVTARDASGEPGGVIRQLLDRFQDLGYSCRATLLNSADYGAYQRRVRCFIVGTANGTAPAFPEPTHQKNGDMLHKQWNSLRMFLEKHADRDRKNYAYPTNSLGQQLESLPNGSGLKSQGRAEKTRPGGHWGYRQGTFIADLDLPARTVTGSSSQDWIRWGGDLRRLTLQEVKLLQGFPIDWAIAGNRVQKFKQIGNAVPTIFGELIGAMINKFLHSFPATPPIRIEMPNRFNGYIDYTKRDHARNGETRVVHKHFQSG